MIIKNMRFICCKNMGGVINVGDVIVIEDITQDNTVLFSFEDKTINGMTTNSGMMSYDEVDKYFKLDENMPMRCLKNVEEQKKVHQDWSEWRCVYHFEFNAEKLLHTLRLEIKNNGRKMKGKLVDTDGKTIVKARCSCFPSDKFYENVGKNILTHRLLEKLFHKVGEEYLDKVYAEYIDEF